MMSGERVASALSYEEIVSNQSDERVVRGPFIKRGH